MKVNFVAVASILIICAIYGWVILSAVKAGSISAYIGQGLLLVFNVVACLSIITSSLIYLDKIPSMSLTQGVIFCWFLASIYESLFRPDRKSDLLCKLARFTVFVSWAYIFYNLSKNSWWDLVLLACITIFSAGSTLAYVYHLTKIEIIRRMNNSNAVAGSENESEEQHADELENMELISLLMDLRQNPEFGDIYTYDVRLPFTPCLDEIIQMPLDEPSDIFYGKVISVHQRINSEFQSVTILPLNLVKECLLKYEWEKLGSNELDQFPQFL